MYSWPILTTFKFINDCYSLLPWCSSLLSFQFKKNIIFFAGNRLPHYWSLMHSDTHIKLVITLPKNRKRRASVKIKQLFTFIIQIVQTIYKKFIITISFLMAVFLGKPGLTCSPQLMSSTCSRRDPMGNKPSRRYMVQWLEPSSSYLAPPLWTAMNAAAVNLDVRPWARCVGSCHSSSPHFAVVWPMSWLLWPLFTVIDQWRGCSVPPTTELFCNIDKWHGFHRPFSHLTNSYKISIIQPKLFTIKVFYKMQEVHLCKIMQKFSACTYLHNL